MKLDKAEMTILLSYALVFMLGAGTGAMIALAKKKPFDITVSGGAYTPRHEQQFGN